MWTFAHTNSSLEPWLSFFLQSIIDTKLIKLDHRLSVFHFRLQVYKWCIDLLFHWDEWSLPPVGKKYQYLSTIIINCCYIYQKPHTFSEHVNSFSPCFTQPLLGTDHYFLKGEISKKNPVQQKVNGWKKSSKCSLLPRSCVWQAIAH